MKHFQTLKHLFRVLFMLTLGFSFPSLQAQTFEVGDNKYTVDGSIHSIVKDNAGNTYVGGNFRSVSSWTGSAVKINTNTGQLDNTMPKVGGICAKILDIPSGGWYIGGTFSHINSVPRKGLARINADGSLHHFNPNILDSPSWRRGDIVMDNNHHTYIAYSNYFGLTKLYKFNNAGNVINNPININGSCRVVIDRQSNVYLIGNFTSVNNEPRNGFCKFDASGNLTSFAPTFDNDISSLVFDNNNNLYVCGIFRNVNNIPRDGLCKFDEAGNLTNFNFTLPTRQSYQIAVDSRSNAYVIPSYDRKVYKFDRFGNPVNFAQNIQYSSLWFIDKYDNVYLKIGSPYTSILKYDHTGAPLPFNVTQHISSYNTIISENSNNFYILGDLATVGGMPFRNFCKLDSVGNTLFSYNLAATLGNSDIRVAIMDRQEHLYVTHEGWTNPRLPAIIKFDPTGVSRNLANNLQARWDIHNNVVNSIALDTLGNLYAWGWMASTGTPTPRNGLCKFDNTGALTSFNPQLGLDSYEDGVNSLIVDANDNLYVGGKFKRVGANVRNNLCKFDNAGNLTSFNPNITDTTLSILFPNDSCYHYWSWDRATGACVRTLTLDNNGNLYVGGNFTSVGGNPIRNNLCKFDNAGNLTSFNPNINGRVHALALDPIGQLYVGGEFTQVGSNATRNNLCKFNSSGNLTNFAPQLNRTVFALAVDTNRNLYVGGIFTSLGGGITRNRLCKFDSMGNLTDFNPNITHPRLWSNNCASVYALGLNRNGHLYAGGIFTHVGNESRTGLCKFDERGNLTDFKADTDTVMAIFSDDRNNLYIGGRFGNPSANYAIFRGEGVSTSLKTFEQTNIKIYPTITSDNVFVEGIQEVYLYNMIGQLVKKPIVYDKGTISLQNLPNGMYILTGKDMQGRSFAQKVIKE